MKTLILFVAMLLPFICCSQVQVITSKLDTINAEIKSCSTKEIRFTEKICDEYGYSFPISDVNKIYGKISDKFKNTILKANPKVIFVDTVMLNSQLKVGAVRYILGPDSR